MASLYCDSFDHYDTPTGQQKNWSVPIIVPTGRHGTKGMTGSMYRPLATVRSRRAIMGCWFRDSVSMGPKSRGGGPGGFGSYGDGSFAWTTLNAELTTYFSAVDLWRPGRWHFIELDVLLDLEG